ncbi:MAG TPA: hypothetical protein PKY25_01000 [Bacilli bacterium]|nr:hypothetical protein [Bacilli bacterium]
MSYVSKFLGVLRRIKEALMNMLRNGKKTISRNSMKEVLDNSKGDDPKVNEAIDELSEEILPEEKVIESSGEAMGQSKVLIGPAGKSQPEPNQFITESKE